MALRNYIKKLFSLKNYIFMEKKMAKETPCWLNKVFMEKVLRNSAADDTIQVIDIFTTLATKIGDNFGSDMLRANVELKKQKVDGRRITEKISVIVKILPQAEGIQRDVIRQLDFFQTEISMMMNTLPKMNEILNLKDSLHPRELYIQKDDPIVLVMEDLVPLGYRMGKRETGLDLPHSLIVIQKLAQFHASSVALCEKDPGQKELYKKGTFHESYLARMKEFYIEATKFFIKELASWWELDSSIYRKILNLSEIIFTKGAEVIECDQSEFNVINHGDCWVNNFLFRYDENKKPIGHKFVDFQLSFYTSPAIDLHYFLNLSLSDEVLRVYEKFLLDEYLKVLTDTMKNIGCKTSAPNAEEFQRYMNKRRMFAVIVSITILPLVQSDKSNRSSLEGMMNKDGTVNIPGCKSALYRKTMCRRLTNFDRSGLLDV